MTIDNARLEVMERAVNRLPSVLAMAKEPAQCFRLPLIAQGESKGFGVIMWLFTVNDLVKRGTLQNVLGDILLAIDEQNLLRDFVIMDIFVATRVPGQDPERHVQFQIRKDHVKEAIRAIRGDLEVDTKERFICFLYHPIVT